MEFTKKDDMKNSKILPLAERLGGVGEYYFSKKLAEVETMRLGGADVISLGIGSPDFPPATEVVEALGDAAANPKAHGYANYKGTPELLSAVSGWYAAKYDVELDPAGEILTLYGSKEGLIFLCNTYINRGDRVLVPNPGYPAYSAAVKMAEGECVTYDLTKENDWAPDFDRLDTTGVKMMFVNYPHMPTGTLPTKDLFEKLVSFARERKILLVHDNPYSFIRNPEPMSLLSVAGAKDVCVELNSLSKSHNMAGWRIGFMVGNDAVLADVLRYKSNLNNAMFTATQHAAAVALGLGDEWYEALNEKYAAREVLGKRIFDTLGVSYAPRQAGLFLWGELPAEMLERGENCYDFCDKLLYEKHIFMTPGGIFGSAGERYVRLSLCADEALLGRVLKRIEEQ